MAKLLLWVAVSKLLVLCLILFAGIGLMPDEAQYWTWAKELSYGYYSKPPGIAWQIAAGCFIFGDTEVGVRIPSLVLSFFLSLSIYWLSRSCGLDEKKSFWSAISFSYCPLGVFSGFFATTDCAFVLFWTIACVLVVKDLKTKRSLSFCSIGFVIAVGALWKWPVYAVWIPIMLFFYKQHYRLFWGMAISLLGLIPSFIWNLKTDYVTFHHVKASIVKANLNNSTANPLEFLGAQAALVSPILFILLIISLWKCRGLDRPLRFCKVTTILFLGAIFLASCFEKVQGNWAVAAYPTGFVLLALYASKRMLQAAIAFSIALITASIFLPLPYKSNPFKQGLGTENIKKALEHSGYNPNDDFLFSDRYQVTSQLSFYGPEQQRAYFFNIHGLRHNQFDFWPQMHELCNNKTGYFVEFSIPQEAARATVRFKQKLLPYFSEIAVLEVQPIYKDQKVAIILRATNYNGTRAPSVNKY